VTTPGDDGAKATKKKQTATVDYIIVLQGEIYAIMDKGETKLRAGDILVQRGTNHSWSVRGRKPCIVAAVLVSATPVDAGARKPARRAAKSAAKSAAKPARKRAQRR